MRSLLVFWISKWHILLTFYFSTNGSIECKMKFSLYVRYVRETAISIHKEITNNEINFILSIRVLTIELPSAWYIVLAALMWCL